MKNICKILLISTIFFWSCGEDRLIPEEENSPAPEDEIIGKKGIGISLAKSQWSHKVSELKVYWHYTWGSILSEYEPDNVDFVPMIWGKNGIDEGKVADLQALKEEGKIKYLLGFNEPDSENQANMTVDEAIEKWPLLEAVGVPLGSPAAVHPTGNWMKEFMAKAEAADLRIDFVSIHWYGGTDSTAFLNKLEEVYNLYGKPLWITEFACADWDAATPGENKHSQEAVFNFMQKVLPKLEKLKYIQRYAWFPAELESAALTSSALWDSQGNLTDIGSFYANFEPNLSIGEGKEPAIDPSLVFSDDFEGYDDNTGLTSIGYTVWEGSAKVLSGEAYKGEKFAQSDASKVNFDVRRTFNLTVGKTYKLEVATKIEDGVKHRVRIYPKEAYESAWVECLNAEWGNHVTQFTVTEGNDEVTISLYRYAKKVLSFDNISLKEVE